MNFTVMNFTDKQFEELTEVDILAEIIYSNGYKQPEARLYKEIIIQAFRDIDTYKRFGATKVDGKGNPEQTKIDAKDAVEYLRGELFKEHCALCGVEPEFIIRKAKKFKLYYCNINEFEVKYKHKEFLGD